MTTKRITSILPILSLFLLIDLATHAQAATYSFKSFDVPGATRIAVNSINDRGQVVGYYDDASDRHGFVYDDGKYTTLDVPGFAYTEAYSINDRGQVAVSGGFVDSEGKYTSLDVPESYTTDTYSINDRGQVVGHYRDTSWYADHGFVYNDGKYTTLDVPGALDTDAYSINDRGQVAGFYDDTSGRHGFVYSEGKYIPFDIPGAWSTGTYQKLNININDCGQVAGQYWDNSGSHGFMYSEGKYTTLDVPGGWGTNAYSINDRGQVVGEYWIDVKLHGFVYNEGKYTTFDVPGANSTSANSINDHGQVAGYYVDASGAMHGFIATPMTPFSAFHVRQLVIDQNRGALFLGSTFTLSKDSNGINPVREEVTLKIANATLTIPAGGFYHQSLFDFAGQIDNIWIWALIKTLGSNRFAFQALAYGVPLGDTKNPVTVELTIGDDYGTTTANASTH